MRNVYLNILGLKENATLSDVKKAYRKKAFEYHPDKNNSVLAQEQFLIINNAYENLTQKSNLEEKDILNNPKASKYVYNLSDKELEERLKNARINNKKKENRERDILNISYKELQGSKILTISNFIASLSILFALLLLSDLHLIQPNTKVYIAQKIEKAPVGQKVHLESTLENETITVTTDIRDANFDVIRTKYIIEVFESKIFKQVYALRNFGHRKVPPMLNKSSFFSIFNLLFVLFLFPATNFIFRGPNTFYLIFVHLNIGFPIVGSLIILFFTL